MAQICLGPFSSSDIDNNLDTAFVLPNGYGGIFNGTTYCFTPSGAGLYVVRYVARDDCGAADTCAVNVTVQLVNDPPIATCHGDTTMTVCSLNQICIGGFSASDPNGNLASITVIGGTYSSGTVCFTPVTGLNTLRLIAVDSCGLADTCITRVTVILNGAPTVTCPNDTVVFIDSLGQQVCISGFNATDPNNNIVTRTVIGATLVGNTACFTPVIGLNTLTFIAVDACGLADTCITHVQVAQAHVGSCPIIQQPFGETTGVCVYGDFCDTIDVVDPDGDYITVTVSLGTLTPILNLPGHWRGLYCFDVPDSACGNDFNYEVLITATDDSCGGFDSAYIMIQVLGKISVDIPDTIFLWPGYQDTFPVLINVPQNCFCMGGFELTVVYDASIFTIIDVFPSDLIDGAEYFFVNRNLHPQGCPLPPSGAFNVVMINDLNNQIPAPPICDFAESTYFDGRWYPGDVLFWVVVMARPDYSYPSNFCVPICFYECEPLNYHWNAITDQSGIYVWKTEGCLDTIGTTNYLELDCGNLKIWLPGDVVIGDVNHNLQPFEVGDAVMLTNYLIDPLHFPIDLWQYWASDVNRDGRPATIADLIRLLNVINGTVIPKISPAQDVPAELVIGRDSEDLTTIRLISAVPVGGFVLEVPAGANTLEDIRVAENLNMDYRIRLSDGLLRLVVYSSVSSSIQAGDNEIITMRKPIEIDPPSISVSVADAAGYLLNSQVKLDQPTPRDFVIINTYPNPFNSTTAIKFGLPESDLVTLKIYDVAGRLVNAVDLGRLSAGYHLASWDGRSFEGGVVASGIYFAKLESADLKMSSDIRKLVLIK